MNDTIYRRDAIQALIDTEEIKGFAYRMLEDRLMEIPSAIKHNFCPNCGAMMFAKDINAPNKEGVDKNPLARIKPKPIPTKKHIFVYRKGAEDGVDSM